MKLFSKNKIRYVVVSLVITILVDQFLPDPWKKDFRWGSFAMILIFLFRMRMSKISPMLALFLPFLFFLATLASPFILQQEVVFPWGFLVAYFINLSTFVYCILSSRNPW
jgi:hypothetical protein